MVNRYKNRISFSSGAIVSNHNHAQCYNTTNPTSAPPHTSPDRPPGSLFASKTSAINLRVLVVSLKFYALGGVEMEKDTISK